MSTTAVLPELDKKDSRDVEKLSSSDYVKEEVASVDMELNDDDIVLEKAEDVATQVRSVSFTLNIAHPQ